MLEIQRANELVQELADPDAEFIFGAIIKESLEDDIEITLVATGFDSVEKTGYAVPDAQTNNDGTNASSSNPFTKIIKQTMQEDDIDFPGFLRK